MSTSNVPKAFVYVEAQASVPFDAYPWQEDNPEMKEQPGLPTKTWLSDLGTDSVGGFYSFDSVENAKTYANGFMAEKAEKLGIGMTAQIFDADFVVEVSKDMDSPFFQ